jgi:predicted amidohydrolase YtcJ
MADRGVLVQRVVPALVLAPELAATPAEAVAYVTDLATRFGDVTNLRFGTAKIFADGVIEFPAQTAALLAPYLDADGNPTDNLGDLYLEGPAMDAVVTALDAAAWQVHIHAIGDRAVRVALDGFAAARAANGDSDLRHTIAHLQLVHPDDYLRFAETASVASMQLQWATRNSFTLDALRPYIGEERWARMYPARSLQQAGAFLAGGSDWPVDPLNPFNQIETAITRVGGYASEPEPLGADQAIDRFDVLRMHTAASAFQIHGDDSVTLEVGKRADLVVLDRDITTSPEDEIKATTVRYTLINGEVVHDAESSSATATTAGFGRPRGRRLHEGLHRHAACCGGGRR